MDTKTVVTIAALAVAGLSLFLGRGSSQPVVLTGNGGGGGIALGDGPTFNFGSGGGGQYTGGGNYPPFNSCGCGKASNGVYLTAEVAPIFGKAISLPSGMAKPVVETSTYVPLVGNGEFV